MANIVITLDGSIGAGKSTILEYLHTKYNVAVEVEPVEKWQPYLNDLYGNMESSAFNLQVRVWLDRCWLRHDMAFPLIMERSPLFQEEVFVRLNHDIGRISNCQEGLIKEMYSKTSDVWTPGGYVYLRTDPLKCIQRIAKRARNAEDAIPVDYMMRLHDLHEQAYNKAVSEKRNIISVDVEGKSVEEVGEEVWSAFNRLRILV